MSSYVDSQGYVRVYDPGNICADAKGYVYEHRKKMADKLIEENPNHPALDAYGCLRKSWMVHHEDEDKGNNHHDNLKVMRGNGKNGHRSHHFKTNNPHPEERDAMGRFI